MKKYLVAAMAIALLGVFSPASADMFAPSHSCRKPYKPYKFTDEWQLQQFKDEVARYKKCINDFVEEQNDAVRTHKDAADEAIEDWNRYVRYELS